MQSELRTLRERCAEYNKLRNYYKEQTIMEENQTYIDLNSNDPEQFMRYVSGKWNIITSRKGISVFCIRKKEGVTFKAKNSAKSTSSFHQRTD